MNDDLRSFEFFGHQVSTRAVEQENGWKWHSSMDGGVWQVTQLSSAWSERLALEEAGIAARDHIRTLREPRHSLQMQSAAVQQTR